jgi:hypothetical protein
MIGAGAFGAMVAGAVAGRALRRWQSGHTQEKSDESEESVEQGGYLLGAMLGTLGLLLAFSFGMVLDRYETRRELAVKEANAIGTAYLRAQMLDEPYRTQLSRLLLDYTVNRIGLASVGGNGTGSIAVNDRLLTELWTTVRSARESALTHGMTTTLLITYNDVIDLDAERKIAWQLRLPLEMLVLLISYLVITAGVVGYQTDGPRGKRAALIMFALLALLLSFVADINRPMSGREAESQKPLEALLRSLQAQPPPVFGGMEPVAPDAGR